MSTSPSSIDLLQVPLDRESKELNKTYLRKGGIILVTSLHIPGRTSESLSLREGLGASLLYVWRNTLYILSLWPVQI